MEGGEDMTSRGAAFDDVEGEKLHPGLEVDADEEGDISDAAFINDSAYAGLVADNSSSACPSTCRRSARSCGSPWQFMCY